MVIECEHLLITDHNVIISRSCQRLQQAKRFHISPVRPCSVYQSLVQCTRCFVLFCLVCWYSSCWSPSARTPHVSGPPVRQLIQHLLSSTVCSSHGFAKEDDIPRFSKSIENATAVLGRSAVLECSVDNLGPDNRVAWLKMDSSNSEPTVLTIGTQTLFGENKYRVSQNGHRQWFLHIKHVRVSDRGNYMCQVNAKTMISQVGFLDVQGKAARYGEWTWC